MRLNSVNVVSFYRDVTKGRPDVVFFKGHIGESAEGIIISDISGYGGHWSPE
jgi:hypothetical protein